MDLWASIKGEKRQTPPAKGKGGAPQQRKATQLTEQERQRRILLQKAKVQKEQQRLLAQQERERAAALQEATSGQGSGQGGTRERESSTTSETVAEKKAQTETHVKSSPPVQETTRKPLPSSLPASPLAASASASRQPQTQPQRSAAEEQARARAKDEAFARHVRETSLRWEPYQQLVVFASTVLLWQRPLVLAGTCVVTHIVLWYSSALLARLRVLQLLCYAAIVLVCGSSALHYLGITRELLWGMLPPVHGAGAVEPLMSYEDVVCAYCAVYRALWEKTALLIEYRRQALPFFTFQAMVVLVAVTYASSMFSGLFLLYVCVFTALLAPGLFFHEAITRGAKALSPHLKTISSQVDMAVGSVIQKKRRSSIANAARKSLSEPFSFVRALAGEDEGQEPAAQAAGHRQVPQQQQPQQLTPQQQQQLLLQQQILAQQQQMAALLAQQQQLGGPLPGQMVQQPMMPRQPQMQQQQQQQPDTVVVPSGAVAPSVDPYTNATAPAQRRTAATQKKVF